jgi:hypothetical protein
VIAPEANNTPQIMLLLHMQIRCYFQIFIKSDLSYLPQQLFTADCSVDDGPLPWTTDRDTRCDNVTSNNVLCNRDYHIFHWNNNKNDSHFPIFLQPISTSMYLTSFILRPVPYSFSLCSITTGYRYLIIFYVLLTSKVLWYW